MHRNSERELAKLDLRWTVSVAGNLVLLLSLGKLYKQFANTQVHTCTKANSNTYTLLIILNSSRYVSREMGTDFPGDIMFPGPNKASKVCRLYLNILSMCSK